MDDNTSQDDGHILFEPTALRDMSLRNIHEEDVLDALEAGTDEDFAPGKHSLRTNALIVRYTLADGDIVITSVEKDY